MQAVCAALSLVVAAIAVRGRRRWVRRERERLRPPTDDTRCRCLDLCRIRGEAARRYLDAHQLPAGPIPHRPEWAAAQCLDTHVRYLHLPEAQLLSRLPTSVPANR